MYWEKRPLKTIQSNDKAFYDSYEWKQIRKRNLIDNPLCEDCKKEGKVNPGRHTDHIIPISDGGDKRDPSNLRTLCARHHGIKTQRDKSRRNRG